MVAALTNIIVSRQARRDFPLIILKLKELKNNVAFYWSNKFQN